MMHNSRWNPENIPMDFAKQQKYHLISGIIVASDQSKPDPFRPYLDTGILDLTDLKGWIYYMGKSMRHSGSQLVHIINNTVGSLEREDLLYLMNIDVFIRIQVSAERIAELLEPSEFSSAYVRHNLRGYPLYSFLSALPLAKMVNLIGFMRYDKEVHEIFHPVVIDVLMQKLDEIATTDYV